MNDTETQLTVLAGHRGTGRCRHCGASVIWVTTAPKGNSAPFDHEPIVLSTFTNPETRVRFEKISSKGIHFASCRVRANKPRVPNAEIRAAIGRRGSY